MSPRPVGDFNGWDRAATPMRFDAARGRWVADVGRSILVIDSLPY